MYYSGTPWAEKEKRFETLLILSKMLDDEMSENHMFSILPNKGGTHEINNHVSLNDISHEINRDLFYEILDELSSEGIISTLGFKSYSIKDINKLNQKIANLNSVGITWDAMRKYYNDDIENNDKKNRQIKNGLFSMPEGKSLKNVVIKFLGDYKIKISIDDKIEEHHLSELGLLKTKNGKYIEKESLKFLLQLSANDGIFPLKNLSNEKREQATIRKKELKKIFQKAFGVKEDPFYQYEKEKNEHKIKIKLIPPAFLRAYGYKDRNIYDKKEKKGHYEDLKEYLDESSPLF